MKKFNVFVSCQVSTMLEIEASTEAEAREKAYEWFDFHPCGSEEVPEEMTYVPSSFEIGLVESDQ